jgi:hypothetical protein
MGAVWIISFGIFAIYMTYVFAKYGVRPSISDSFYGVGWLFTIWCFVVGISVAAMLLDLSEGKWWQFLSFFAGGGLCLVGAAPRFKTFEAKTHFTGAATCAVSAVIWMILAGWWIVPTVAVVIAAGVSWKYPQSKVLWFELAAFTSTFTVSGILEVAGAG